MANRVSSAVTTWACPPSSPSSSSSRALPAEGARRFLDSCGTADDDKDEEEEEDDEEEAPCRTTVMRRAVTAFTRSRSQRSSSGDSDSVTSF
jgi:hypothetical protein